ncbi:MAG: TylF/MycF family methyltransferase [Spirochaetaceae bacterium]|jgi:O-methyltransferase|nr:TylF/MycF family methyltransferase [Spirochaetaceae bacterium]
MIDAIVRLIREIVISWLIRLFASSDIVRWQMLKLIADEIREKNIDGSIAELGVYKGDFAKLINEQFPEKKLYLFDTFDGFDERDIKTEVKIGGYGKKNDFKNNNIELVMKKMKYPNNCIIKKGWFPESGNGVEDRFLFVSIDTDLFEPTYHGLKFFYDRLEKGGYIFVHDYNGKLFGAKQAVRKFSKEYNIPYVPLSDLCGSVVFSK